MTTDKQEKVVVNLHLMVSNEYSFNSLTCQNCN